MDEADIVILEVNKNYPHTFGDVEVHVNDIDYLVEIDYLPPLLLEADSNEKDGMIGSFIAEYINDGDCIQFGIGGIPNAVANALMDKKNLCVHTEMLTTGLMKLAKAGVVNGKNKTLHKGKMVCTFVLGTQELYNFVHNNPSVLVLDGQHHCY